MSTDEYNPQAIERKWQARWAESGIYRTPEPNGRRTFYCLEFFPYPSGDGLSVGHGRNYVPTDVISRYRRMLGDAVLHPMGWDAFGLPAENEAIRKGIHPRETTRRYAANYRRQMTLIGCSYDWEREINSSHPDFYRWTQWIFLLLYRNGLAYRAVGKQWWCPGCRTVLADEQVESGGVCWRGHSGVHKRDLEQWFFRITTYADELLAELDKLDWPEHILAMQRNWIGRSEGVEFEMPVAELEARFTVFTTRPDTLCGMTFAVLAPEHPLVAQITAPEHRSRVEHYCREAKARSEVERLSAGRDGVFTGAYAINPANGERVPIYVADYVLTSYGGGAIMAVPAHDARDYEFAQRHTIPTPVVITPPDGAMICPYTEPGVMVNSGRWDGLPSQVAAEQIADWLESEGIGRRVVQYRLRDWLISRQRYWGAPIPIIYCAGCGVVPVPESDLPVLLPHVAAWQPAGNGRSPLANIPGFVRTACPTCGRPARRETDTLDGFACSSWYFLRFVSPRYQDGPFDPAALAQWGPPDLYVGGGEHAVMHLLYARFWTKVLADAESPGRVPFREPFPVLRSQGVMHARDPETGQVRRMSKSAGNVVTPDSMAEQHGADALRLYLLFMAPFENNTIWEEDGITGAKRFLQRVWRLADELGGLPGPAQPRNSADEPATNLPRRLHQAIREVTGKIEGFQFNTAIAALMTLLNEMEAHRRKHGATAELAKTTRPFVLLLAPFAPHIAEELWERLGGDYSIHQQRWPDWNPALAADEVVTLVVQVDGRVRDRLTVSTDMAEGDIRKMALSSERVVRHLAGRAVEQVIVVPGRVVSIVTRDTH